MVLFLSFSFPFSEILNNNTKNILFNNTFLSLRQKNYALVLIIKFF